MSKKNTPAVASKKNARKALAPNPQKNDTRPRDVAKADKATEKTLLARLEKARASGDRKEGKKIRRALRRIGHWGGLRLNVTPAKA